MTMLHRTAGGLALALAAGLAIAGAGAAPARAADLGGDCCSDLEERVAELEATTVRHGNRKVTMTISGWVNAGVLIWDDGFDGTDNGVAFDHNNDIYVVNNDASTTRINFEGSGKIRDDLTAGYRIQLRPWGARLGNVSQVDHNPDSNQIDVRNTYVYLDSKSLGKVQIGKQDSAADGAWYQDLGGSSTWISNVNPGAWNYSFNLRQTPGNWLDTLVWGNLLSEMSDSQENRIAYYSPSLHGFQIAASWGGDDTEAVALYYANTYGTVNVAFGIGYDVSSRSDALGDQNVGHGLVDGDHTTLRKLAMSGSVYESRSGIYGTLAWSKAYADDTLCGCGTDRTDATNWYAKLGWRRNVSGLGESNFYGEFDRTVDAFQNDTAAHIWGVGFTQDIDSVGSVFYIGYRHHELEDDVNQYVLSQHFDAVLTGLVVNF